MNLPKPFLQNIVRIWGTQGTLWLQQLPFLIEHFAIEWQLKEIQHFENLSFNYVAHAYSNLYKQPVVLKIGAPHPSFINELKALTFYNGHGSVKLLAYDEQKYGMLLAQIQPGSTLKSFFPAQDEKAVEYACQVMKKLHAHSLDNSQEFPTIDNKFLIFDTLKIPRRLQKHVDTARNFVKELSISTPQKFLLHGDLHHDNILLDAQGNAVSIDPKGVIGEAAYEVGAFMCNPEELSGQPDVAGILNNRLDSFSSRLKIDRNRLAKACYARIILSACWTVEAKGNWHDDAQFAEYIYPKL
jgi:streptomycin 6-kinase